MASKIGFIGIGMMGHGIAKNLLKAGHSVTTMAHKNRAPLEDLLDQGAVEVRTPRQVAEASEIVMVCVTGAPQFESVIYGDDGVMEAANGDRVIIDCTTNEPAMTERAHRDFQAIGATFVDAPLALTPKEAEEGNLNIMVGASNETFAALRPIIETFAANIVHTGEVGTAIRTKLVYNFLAMGTVALVAEALCAAKASGLDMKRFYDTISAGGANSGIFQRIMTRAMEAGDYEGLMFSVANAAKDITYYTRMTDAVPLTGNLGNAVHHALIQASNMGLANEYVGSLIEAQARLNNVKIF